MSLEQNKAQARLFFEELDRHNFEIIESLLTPDFVAHDAQGGPPSDRASAKAFFQMLYGAFPDLKTKIHAMVAEADKVCVRKTCQGTHQGSFMGIPPTGKAISIDIIDFFQFSGDRIAVHWHGMDSTVLPRQLGMNG